MFDSSYPEDEARRARRLESIYHAGQARIWDGREVLAELLEKHPVRAVEKAIRGMLPKNSLGRQQLKKLKVYAGPEHPHAAQQPKPFTLTQVAS